MDAKRDWSALGGAGFCPLIRTHTAYEALGVNASARTALDDEELRTARMDIVKLMEAARTATYDDVDMRHCPVCDYRLICPAASLTRL